MTRTEQSTHIYVTPVGDTERKKTVGRYRFCSQKISWSVIWRDVILSKKYKRVQMKIADYRYRYRYSQGIRGVSLSKPSEGTGSEICNFVLCAH